MKDIDYFSEEKMNETNLKSFASSLPKHLQSKFKESIKGGELDVLQGYRGPNCLRNGGSGDSATEDEYLGVQRIAYWYGASKTLNFLPIIGWIAYGVTRAIQSSYGFLDWSSIYFDVATGEMLDEFTAKDMQNRNKKAEEYFVEGKKNFETENYEEAINDFTKAYFCCSNKYVNQAKFKEMLDRAIDMRPTQIYREADSMAQDEEYESALNLYKRAEKLSIDSVDRQRSRNEQSCMLKNIGDRLRSKGCLTEAKRKYIEASNMTNDEELLTQINNSFALIYGKEGESLFETEKYEDAKRKFELAVQKTRNTFEKDNFQDWLKKADREVEVSYLINEAKLLEKAQKLTEAIITYEIAERKTQETIVKGKIQSLISELKEKQKRIFEEEELNAKTVQIITQSQLENKTKALDRVNIGHVLMCEGNLLKIDEKYDLAIAKYDEAERLFEEAAEIHPSNVVFDSIIKLITAYYQVKNCDKAKTLINKAILVFPEKAEDLNETLRKNETEDIAIDYVKSFIENK